MGSGASTEAPKAPGMDGNKNCHALLLGMTGSGKTSFLNFVCSYRQMKAYLNKQVPMPENPLPTRNLTSAERNASKDESQTDEAITYTIKRLLKDRDLKIIDCPGFGDTR